MIYGYIRVSTKTQNLERQERNIREAYPTVDRIFADKFTGTKMLRPDFLRLKKVVKPGDTIVFDSVSRMARNAEEGWNQYSEWDKDHINLVFLKEPHINTDMYHAPVQVPDTGDAVLNKTLISGLNAYLMCLAEKQVRLAFEQAQKEVDDLHQRVKEGMAVAKSNGKQIGSRKGDQYNIKGKAEAKKKILENYKGFEIGKLDAEDTARLAQVSRNTFFKYCKEIREEMERG